MFKTVLWLGISALLVSSSSTDSILLRRKLQEGQKDVYRLEMRMQHNATLEGSMFGGMPSDVPIDMGGSMKVILVTGKLSEDKKEAEIEMEVAEPKWNFEIMGQVQDVPSDVFSAAQKIVGRLDERNRLNIMNIPGLPSEFAGFARSVGLMGIAGFNMNQLLFVEFPEKKINMGDTWEVKIPPSPLTGNKEVILQARLIGEREEGGKPAYEVSMEGTIPINFDLKQLVTAIPMLQAQGMDIKMLMTGTVKVEVNALLEKDSGRTLYLKNMTTNDQVVEIPDFGMKMIVRGTMLSVARISKDES